MYVYFDNDQAAYAVRKNALSGVETAPGSERASDLEPCQKPAFCKDRLPLCLPSAKWRPSVTKRTCLAFLTRL